MARCPRRRRVSEDGHRVEGHYRASQGDSQGAEGRPGGESGAQRQRLGLRASQCRGQPTRRAGPPSAQAGQHASERTRPHRLLALPCGTGSMFTTQLPTCCVHANRQRATGMMRCSRHSIARPSSMRCCVSCRALAGRHCKPASHLLLSQGVTMCCY